MNEVVQNIKFHKSRLNWDADISLMGEGESKYFLNTVPEDSEHAGVRTNCLGTTQSTIFLSKYYDDWTVTTTSPTTTTKKFEFTLDVVPQLLEMEVMLDGELKHLFVSAAGYATLSAFYARLIVEVRKYFEDDLSAYGTSGSTIYFTFKTSLPSQTTLQVRKRLILTYPATLKVIGSLYDGLTDHTYYWVYDTATSNQRYLLEYINYNDVLVEIPITNGLDAIVINENSFVSNSFIVGTAKDRLLYWHYNGLNAFKINIYDRLTSYWGSDYTLDIFYFKVDKSVLDQFSSTVTPTASASKENSETYFLVRSRLKYIDGERTVFSPIFPLAYPYSYAENSVGVKSVLSNYSYAIRTNISFYGSALIDSIEYAVKEGGGNWALTDLPVTTSTSGYEIVSLAGREPSIEVAQSSIDKLFDYVPQQHGVQCLVNNRLITGDCTEGYDNVAMTSTVTYTEDTSYPSAPTIYLTSAFTGTGPYTTIVTPLTVSASEWKTHCIYVKTSAGKEYFGYVQDDYDMTQVQLCDALVAALAYEVSAGGDSSNILTSRSSSSVAVISTIAGATCRYLVFRSYTKQRTLKHGATPYLGVVYSDIVGRSGGVNPITTTEVARDGAYDYPTTADVAVTNDNPTWARYAQLFYGGSSIQSYTQAVIKRADISIKKDYLEIFIDEYVVNSQIINPASRMASYVFTPGDKLVFIGYKSTATVSLESQTFTYTTFPHFTAIETLEVLSQDESCIYVRKPSNSIVLSEINNCTYAHIEVYTPTKDKPIEYKETSCFSSYTHLIDPSFSLALDHMINQTFYIDDGIPVSAWIESESFSNYFESKTLGLGRANFYNQGFKQQRRNILRASNQYIPNTNINGLSTFDWNDEVALDEEYGFITGLKMVGNALKIIQPRKISSMYIGAEVGVDANGNQVLFRSDKVLTEPRYGSTDFGSMHPESIVAHGSYLYGYDVVNSVVWRDTPGGTFAISDNAMRSYFKYKTRQLVSSCGYSFKAVGGYDYQNEMYLLTFKDPSNSSNDETIGFHEPTESWYSFYSFKPEMYCGVPGDYLLSFNVGNLYTHSSATRNNFYSTQYYSDAWVVGNVYPDDVKKWNSLVVNSNDPWYAPEILVDEDSIAHQDTENYTTHKGKMQSLLNENHFRVMNGEFRAEFLRDLLTSDPDTVTPTDAINGRALTGKTILIKLRNGNAVAVYLRGVRINAQIAR